MWTDNRMFFLLQHQMTRLPGLKIAQAGFCLVFSQEITQTNLLLLQNQQWCHCCPIHRAPTIQPQEMNLAHHMFMLVMRQF